MEASLQVADSSEARAYTTRSLSDATYAASLTTVSCSSTCQKTLDVSSVEPVNDNGCVCLGTTKIGDGAHSASDRNECDTAQKSESLNNNIPIHSNKDADIRAKKVETHCNNTDRLAANSPITNQSDKVSKDATCEIGATGQTEKGDEVEDDELYQDATELSVEAVLEAEHDLAQSPFRLSDSSIDHIHVFSSHSSSPINEHDLTLSSTILSVIEDSDARFKRADEEGDETAQIDALIVRIFHQLEGLDTQAPTAITDVLGNEANGNGNGSLDGDGAHRDASGRQHAGLERWLREKGLRTAECAICCDSCICVRQMCCSLPVCVFCLRRYFHTRIDSGALQIACPNGECKQFVDRSEVTYFVNAAHKQRFYTLLADANQFPNTRTCPSCSSFYTLTPEQAFLLHAANGSGEHGAVLDAAAMGSKAVGSTAKAQRKAAVREIRRIGLRIDCTACGASWCFACHANYHFETTCADFRRGDKLVTHWARQRNAYTGRNAQRCPRCHVMIEKTSGCNHMTCQRCSTEFCYLCGRRYLNVKYLGNHDSRFSVFGCKYKLLPENAPARNAIRGSVFVAKLMMCTLVGTIVTGCFVALIPVGVVAAPAVGIYVAVRKGQRKRRLTRRARPELSPIGLVHANSSMRIRNIDLPGSNSGPALDDEPSLVGLDWHAAPISFGPRRVEFAPTIANRNDEPPVVPAITNPARSAPTLRRATRDSSVGEPDLQIDEAPAASDRSVAREHDRIDEAPLRGRAPTPIEIDGAFEWRNAPAWFVMRPPTPPPEPAVVMQENVRRRRRANRFFGRLMRGFVDRMRTLIRL